MKVLIFISVFCLTVLYNVSGQTTPQEMLNKAIYQEEVNGNLEEAIKLFSEIVDKNSTDRAVIVEALYHLGLSNEKMGNKKAREYYEKIVTSFADQPEFVKVAKERLYLLLLADKELKSSPKPKFSKINIPSKIRWAVWLLPDGQNLGLISDDKIWIMPLSGNLGQNIPGKPIQVNTEDIKVEDTDLSWSRDGKWLAFNDPGMSGPNQKIYIVPSGGGKPREIIENYRGSPYINYRISLSPDGKMLAFSSIENNTQHIYSISTQGGTPVRLADMQAREPAFSPDGTLIAFVEDKNLGEQMGGCGLWVVPASGGTPSMVAEAGTASCPVWSPDGKMIAFIDLSQGKFFGNQIIIVPVSRNGQNAGKVTRIDVPEGIEGVRPLVGWTPDNKIGALFVTKQEFEIYTLPSNGGQTSMVLHDRYALQPRWSPDGKQIFYTTTPLESDNPMYNLFLASVPSAGGNAKPLPKIKEVEIAYSPYQGGNRISPDGNWIISAVVTQGDTSSKFEFPKTKIRKIAIDGSKSIQITNPNGDYADLCPSWSPDGKKVAFIRTRLQSGMDPFGEYELYSVDSAGGEPELLTSLPGKYIFSSVWSPDGKMIAYLTKYKGRNPGDSDPVINILNLNSRESKVVGKVPAAHVNIELAWSPDSKQIAFNGKTIHVMNIDDKSIKDIKTNLPDDVGIWHLDWSSDGKQFVFAGGKGGTTEFWLLENFLPLEKLAQNNEKEDLKESKEIRIRQVWTGPDVDNSGSISADGEYLTFTNWTTGNLEILDLKSNKNNQVTNWGSWKDSVQYADKSLVSPDGKQIAYLWFRDRGEKGNYELRLIKVGNQIPVTLYYCSKNEYIIPEIWFSNGNTIIVQLYNSSNNTWKLSSINITNGEIHLLLQKENVPEYSLPLNLSLSPDEKQVAFDFPNSTENGKYDIFLLSVDSKTEIPIVKYPANDRLLGWLPGSDKLLFTSDRSGTTDVWAFNTSEEKKSEDTKCILTNIGDIFDPIGFTKQGSLYFSIGTFRNESFIVPFDNYSGRVSISHRISFSGMIYDICWLPDGKSLICTKNIVEPDKSWSNSLYLLNSQSGEAKALAGNLKIEGQIRLSPDGKSVLVLGLDKKRINDKIKIYSVDIATGLPVEIKVKQDISQSNSVEWDKEGINIFYTTNDKIIKHNIISGEEMIMYTDKRLLHTILTRTSDGNHLLFDVVEGFDDKGFSLCKLLKVPDTGGEPKIMCSYHSLQNWRFKRFALAPDGKYIYFSESEIASGDKSILYRIPAAGGTPEKIWEVKDYFIAGISVHPGGRQIALSDSHPGIEIRAIENLGKKVTELYSKDN